MHHFVSNLDRFRIEYLVWVKSQIVCMVMHHWACVLHHKLSSLGLRTDIFSLFTVIFVIGYILKLYKLVPPCGSIITDVFHVVTVRNEQVKFKCFGKKKKISSIVLV